MSNQAEKIKELIELRDKARMGGGEKAIAKQHEKGKMTARERILHLLDPTLQTDISLQAHAQRGLQTA